METAAIQRLTGAIQLPTVIPNSGADFSISVLAEDPSIMRSFAFHVSKQQLNIPLSQQLLHQLKSLKYLHLVKSFGTLTVASMRILVLIFWCQTDFQDVDIYR
jgi:hypothetical protein